jgi:proteasome accessory factor C
MKYEPQHEFYRPDIFGFQGKAMNKEIEIEMNLRACLVLKEEFPMSIPFILESSGKDSYLLKAKVQSYLAPGRFVLGLHKDTKVNGSTDFIKFLNKPIKKIS